ncbi:LysR family transcriptional regulator [Haliangium sp.]|uniref:LysR family transcriptional regulator n=1 Tax=Haliangium sp. TaxID=2663208 RepID=UPI003D1171F3
MHIYGIDANLLVSLDALLREASVTRAAKRVGLTQSAMSHALGRLREHLGDPLLVRAGRRMVLTPRAEALAPRVARLVEDMSQVFAPDEGFDPAELQRAFSLRTTDHVLLVLMPELDALLNAEAPGVDILASSLTDAGPEGLRRGQCDLTIGVFSDLPSDIHEKALFDDRFVCLVRRGHPVAEPGLTLARYSELPHVLVAPRGTPHGIVDTFLAERGVHRRVARMVPHFLVAPFLVAGSDAVVTMSERLAHKLAPALDLCVLEPPIPLPSYDLSMAWHERQDHDPAHRWLRELMVRAAGRLPALERRPGLAPGDPGRGRPRTRKPS